MYLYMNWLVDPQKCSRKMHILVFIANALLGKLSTYIYINLYHIILVIIGPDLLLNYF